MILQIIILGDLNASVGKGAEGTTIGPFEVGKRNDREDKWVQWCVANQFSIMNTWFQQHNRRLWTWRSLWGCYKNQIDYIAINNKFRNSGNVPGRWLRPRPQPISRQIAGQVKNRNRKLKTF